MCPTPLAVTRMQRIGRLEGTCERRGQTNCKTLNFDIVLDDRDAMIDYLFPDLTKEQTIDANETYELLLALGADMSVPRTTVAGLLSPQIFGATGAQDVSGLQTSWVWEDVGFSQCG